MAREGRITGGALPGKGDQLPCPVAISPLPTIPLPLSLLSALRSPHNPAFALRLASRCRFPPRPSNSKASGLLGAGPLSSRSINLAIDAPTSSFPTLLCACRLPSPPLLSTNGHVCPGIRLCRGALCDGQHQVHAC